ncbi:hypothetical protein IV203_026229 [Nitzschia inconspicua]|uniref:Uncharacterized protein n=1 Tax=Nitzschia inconspicua TaxID=303405 RepID=A0A9K3LI94_9STRA|nr:hypothetical protein IV203_026229 [Nitzschia inconspicua]
MYHPKRHSHQLSPLVLPLPKPKPFQNFSRVLLNGSPPSLSKPPPHPKLITSPGYTTSTSTNQQSPSSKLGRVQPQRHPKPTRPFQLLPPTLISPPLDQLPTLERDLQTWLTDQVSHLDPVIQEAWTNVIAPPSFAEQRSGHQKNNPRSTYLLTPLTHHFPPLTSCVRTQNKRKMEQIRKEKETQKERRRKSVGENKKTLYGLVDRSEARKREWERVVQDANQRAAYDARKLRFKLKKQKGKTIQEQDDYKDIIRNLEPITSEEVETSLAIRRSRGHRHMLYIAKCSEHTIEEEKISWIIRAKEPVSLIGPDGRRFTSITLPTELRGSNVITTVLYESVSERRAFFLRQQIKKMPDCP